MMPFSCKQRMCKNSPRRDSAMKQQSIDSSACSVPSRCRVIAIVPSHYRVITPSPVVPSRHRHHTIVIAPLLQLSTLRWCDSELHDPDFIHLGLLYFLHVEILEIYTYHRLSYIIYIFCTVPSVDVQIINSVSSYLSSRVFILRFT